MLFSLKLNFYKTSPLFRQHFSQQDSDAETCNFILLPKPGGYGHGKKLFARKAPINESFSLCAFPCLLIIEVFDDIILYVVEVGF